MNGTAKEAIEKRNLFLSALNEHGITASCEFIMHGGCISNVDSKVGQAVTRVNNIWAIRFTYHV